MPDRVRWAGAVEGRTGLTRGRQSPRAALGNPGLAGWRRRDASRALRFVGVGRAPLSLLLMVLFFAWGFLGVATNALLLDVPPLAAAPWLVSLPVAFAGSLAVTRAVGAVVGRWLPTTETYVLARAGLVGRSGEAVLPVDREFGLAVVRDRQGNSHRVACRVYPDGPPLPKGAAVLVVDYDPNQLCYYVIPSDVEI